MPLQVRGDKRLLFPAWPRDGNVDFKPHALRNTTIEDVYRNGRMRRLTIMPTRRTRDIILPPDFRK